MPGFDEFNSLCVCGCENFERVVVERVLSKPVVTDLLACVECRCVYYSPLPRPEAVGARLGPAMPSGVVSDSPGLLSAWGGVLPVHRANEQSAEDLQRIKQASARANKSKRKR